MARPVPPRARRLAAAATLLLLTACLAGRPPGPQDETADSPIEEHWYSVVIGDTTAGWMKTREARADGRLTTESTLRLKLQRGPSEQEIETATGVVETAEGRPVRAWTRQRLGSAPIETRYEFGADDVVVTTRRAGRETTERRPWPEGDWLTPGAAEAEIRRRLASDAPSFRQRTFDPELGLEPIEVDWQLEERGVEVEAAGRTYLTRRFRQTVSFAPQLASLVHLTDDGLLVRMSVPILGTMMTVTLASRETLGTQTAPELLAPTFVRPNRPIADPRGARRAVYELRFGVSEVVDLPTGGYQRAEAASGSTRVVVDLDAAPAAADDDRGDYLRSSIYVDHQDPAVRRLLAEATGETGEEPAEGADAARSVATRSVATRSVATTAETLRAFVGDYLTDKNLEVLLATASEVAKSRAGDCTEHSMLLAALLRADGIPARLVAGLVYVDGFLGERRIFGYHMWAQARIEDRWVDLDASFEAPFDATHIAFATTALDDGATAARELGRIAPLIGKTEIRVLEVEHGGE